LAGGQVGAGVGAGVGLGVGAGVGLGVGAGVGMGVGLDVVDGFEVVGVVVVGLACFSPKRWRPPPPE